MEILQTQNNLLWTLSFHKIRVTQCIDKIQLEAIFIHKIR